jgi:inhibitor of KinA sporulation pathway (predicted exonuclease)
MPRIDTFADPRLESLPKDGTIVVFDLEYTSWKGSLDGNWSRPCEQREVVQFGAVKARISDRGFEAGDRFACLVRPLSNPRLSRHFIGLTGITQERLEREGVSFTKAWEDFCCFCSGVGQLWCMGWDAEVLRENFILRNIPGGLPAPCFDIRPALAKTLGLEENEVVSSRLLGLLNLEPIGPAHQADFDALAVLAALNYLAGQGRLA